MHIPSTHPGRTRTLPQHYCFLTACPLYLHLVTSPISNYFILPLGEELREDLGGGSLFPTNKKGRAFIPKWAPTGSCLVLLFCTIFNKSSLHVYCMPDLYEIFFFFFLDAWFVFVWDFQGTNCVYVLGVLDTTLSLFWTFPPKICSLFKPSWLRLMSISWKIWLYNLKMYI